MSHLDGGHMVGAWAPGPAVSKWDPARELASCREALHLLREGEAGVAWNEAMARLDLGSAGARAGGRALESWKVAAELVEGVEGVVAVGAPAAGLRRGVPLPILAATVPLELLVARADAPRLRLRLGARGFSPGAEGWLTGPHGGRVVIRDRLVPAGFGRVPVLVFSQGAGAVDRESVRLPVASRGASWAAAVVRAGVGALVGSRWARLSLTAAVLEAQGLGAGEKSWWRERLRLWGIGRLVAVVEAWTDWIEAGEGGSGIVPELPQAGGSTRGRLLAGMRLQDGIAGALRFAAAQLLGGGDGGWV